jgi:hypothetical protein
MVTEEHVGPATEPTLRDLSEALIAVDGTDYGIQWVGDLTQLGLADALTNWFGPPTAA